MPQFSTFRASKFLRELDESSVNRYREYWRKITPKDHHEYWKRWIFAFMSIHTTWKQNVKGYRAVTSLPRNFTKEELENKIQEARIGLNTIRSKGIWQFNQSFNVHPELWYPKPNESWQDCRDRLVSQAFGIGITKVSFVLEMLQPEQCQAVCLDTHILQLYGLGAATPATKLYKRVEDHWLNKCATRELPSPLARHIYWDRKQGQPLNNYWAHVFEE